MTTLLLGRPINRRHFLGRLVVSVRTDGRMWSAGPAGGTILPSPSGHYTHSIWGPTAKLTPPPAMQGNYLEITDLDHGKDGDTDPDGQLWEEVGGDGQVVRGGWVTVTRNSVGGSTDKVPGGRVYTVVVDGNGADVWINGNRDGQGNFRPDINYHMVCFNCRTLRITGLKVFIDDIRKAHGGWPDSQWTQGANWHGMNNGLSENPGNFGSFEQIVDFRHFNNDSVIFIEGCDIDMNEGGVRQHYRTDVFSSIRNGTPSNGNDKSAWVLQNSRVWGVNSDYFDTHADIHHFMTQNYIRYYHVENVEAWTKFQGFQTNYSNNNADARDARMHMRFYNLRYEAYVGGVPGKPFFFSQGAHDRVLFPSLEFEGVHMSRTGGVICSPPDLMTAADNPVIEADFHTARSNIERYRDYGDGLIQPNMSNADGARVLQGFNYYNNATGTMDIPRGSYAPTAHIGNNYQTIWAADGTLLTEA